jgi:hypothetical protein
MKLGNNPDRRRQCEVGLERLLLVKAKEPGSRPTSVFFWRSPRIVIRRHPSAKKSEPGHRPIVFTKGPFKQRNTNMTSSFEIHPGLAAGETCEKSQLGRTTSPVPVLSLIVGPADTLLVSVDPDTGEPRMVDDASRAMAVFRMVRRGRMGNALAMISQAEDILVNGLPALPLSVLSPKDSITLGPSCLCFITERIKPHVGQPSGEQLTQKCPFCRLVTDAGTRVVTCLCGAAYHWETPESHPNAPENDRLRCFEKIQNCLSCGRQLSKEETLVWDPATL